MTLRLILGARKKSASVPLETIFQFYRDNYSLYEQYDTVIDSVYGFAENCLLYGGRKFEYSELSRRDIHMMYDRGIGYRIPLQSYHVTDEIYKNSHTFLNKYHRDGNTIVVMMDELAYRIRNDFPKYKLEASVLMELSNTQDIKEKLQLYDSVVADPKTFDVMNSGLTTEEKQRVILFGTHFCFVECEDRSCHKWFSAMNSKTPCISGCVCASGNCYTVPKTEVDITEYVNNGFRNIKLYNKF